MANIEGSGGLLNISSEFIELSFCDKLLDKINYYLEYMIVFSIG
jgi:hypothetical protein